MDFFNLAKKYFFEGLDSLKKKDFSDAESKFLQSLDLAPDRVSVLINLSAAQLKLKKYTDAKISLEKVIRLEKVNPEPYLNLGLIEIELERFEEAISCFDKAINLKPDYAEAYSNKGNVLNELERFEEAISCFDKAINLKPDYFQAMTNKGASLHQIKAFEEAINLYDKALFLKPNYHEALWNKSLCMLIKGDFKNGFPLYESRWKSKKIRRVIGERSFHEPIWSGAESLKNKTILLYREQGLGDFIQFSRYSQFVVSLGARVILEVPHDLMDLMSNLHGVSRFIVKGQSLPAFDFCCPIMSLPFALSINQGNISSFSGDIQFQNKPNKLMEWQARLGSSSKKRIGLVWSGNPLHKNDHNRSIPLRDIIPFLPNQFEYVSLQKEIRVDDKLTLELNPQILSFTKHLKTFSDTAALIGGLDLVISVDTSVAHLSGALHKPTWILLPFVPDWRWLLDRDDSPWYPSIRLFRQEKRSDWSAVFKNLSKALRIFAEQN